MADPFFADNPHLQGQRPGFDGMNLDGIAKWLNLPSGKCTITLGRHATVAKEVVRPQKHKRLSWAHRKKMGLCQIGKKDLKFTQLWPVHELWLGYMRHLLKPDELLKSGWDNSPSHPQFESVNAKLYRADFHGALVKIIAAKCATYVGLIGIIAMETKNVYKIVSRDNRTRTVLKKLSQFEFELDSLKFTFFGHNFVVRPADRSNKKVKLIRPPIIS